MHLMRSAACTALAGVALVAVTGCVGPAPSSVTAAAWCDGFEQERLAPAQRMTGRNRERLVAAQRLVAPGLAETRLISGLSLLGGYQEEMSRPRPDTAVAATYLATASAYVVTLETVRGVNALLCVSTTTARANAIAAAASTTQRDMVAEARP
jgi:hypothetical protein